MSLVDCIKTDYRKVKSHPTEASTPKAREPFREHSVEMR